MKNFLMTLETILRDGLPHRLKPETLASRLTVEVRTVRRYIADTVACGFLIYRPSRNAAIASEFEINWYAIKECLLNNPSTAHEVDPHAPVFAPSRPDSTCDNFAGTCDNLATTCDNFAGTCDKFAPGDSKHTSYTRTRVLNHELNHSETISKPLSENDGLNTSRKPKNRAASGAVGGWPFQITRQDLQTPERIQLLWSHARSRGWVANDDFRHRVFRLAKFCGDDLSFENPGGRFTTLLRSACWSGSEAQDQWATDAIRQFDRPSRPAPTALPDDDVQTFEANKQAQLRAARRMLGGSK